MSYYDVDRIEKPPFFGIRPTKQGRGKRTPFIVGFDSEGDESKPFLFQFSEQGTTEDETILLDVPDVEHAGLYTFMTYVVKRLLPRHFSRSHEVIIYGFNLSYEWTQLFHDDERIAEASDSKMIINLHETSTGNDHEFLWTIYNDKRVFAKLEHKTSKLQIRILDARMFYKTGLDAAAKMLGLGEKYANEHLPCGQPGAWHQSGHAREEITRALARDDEFLAYARRDAFITRLIGEQIIGLHETYDIRQTISAPHFASAVFKRRFLKQEVTLPQRDLEQVGLWSYHGGKNGFYLNKPTLIEDCYQYDITSAYPEAMRQLPNIETAEWKQVSHYTPGRHGIYTVTLRYDRCQFRGMLNHDGTWPESGYIEDICLTSYEIDAMVSRGECEIITARGWEMRGLTGGPLVEFVDTFFAQKATTTGAERETAKLLLNSLYGKFFQKVALGTMLWYDFDSGEFLQQNTEGMFDFRAGGLYHPPIASLITGYVRAKIHLMEHKYRAVMTSTDGIFAYEPPDPADLGKHLGGLTCERGTLHIWRERLYVFTSPDLAKPKSAYHGFWGSHDDLMSIPLAHGTYEYGSRHMVTLKESLHRFDGVRYPPGSFIDIRRSITI